MWNFTALATKLTGEAYGSAQGTEQITQHVLKVHSPMSTWDFASQVHRGCSLASAQQRAAIWRSELTTNLWPPGAQSRLAGHSTYPHPASWTLSVCPGQTPSCPALASMKPLGRSTTKGDNWKTKERLQPWFCGAGSFSSGHLGDSQFSQELQTWPSDQEVQIRFRL